MPTMEQLRSILAKFSELEIPMRDEIREYLGLVPAQQEDQVRAGETLARKQFNDLYRTYSLAFRAFKRVYLLFLSLLLVLVNLALLLRPFNRLRAVEAICASVALLWISFWLKPQIAPAANTVVGVDYIGRYFARLHFLSLFRIANITLIPHRDDAGNSCKFLMNFQTLILGFKYLLLVTDIGETALFFVSYGTISGSQKFSMIVGPVSNEFEFSVGEMSLASARIQHRSLKYKLLIFLPDPITWRATTKHPHVVDSSAFYTWQGDNPGFLVGPFQAASTQSGYEAIKFERQRVLGFQRWRVRGEEDLPASVLKYAKEMCSERHVAWQEFAEGVPLV